MSGDTGFSETEPVMGHSDLERQLHEERNLARRQCERVIVLLRELRESEEEMLLTAKPKAIGRWAAAMEAVDQFLHEWTTKGPRWSLDKTLKTRSGKELPEEIERVAAAMEAGIDPAKLRPRRKS